MAFRIERLKKTEREIDNLIFVTLPRNELICQLFFLGGGGGHRKQLISYEMNIWHQGQL